MADRLVQFTSAEGGGDDKRIWVNRGVVAYVTPSGSSGTQSNLLVGRRSRDDVSSLHAIVVTESPENVVRQLNGE